MDPRRFDTLVRTLGAAASRRTALVALLSGLIAPLLPGADTAAKRGKAKHKNRNRRKRPGNGHDDRGKTRAQSKRRQERNDRRKTNTTRAEQLPANCCSTNNCTPGPGKNLGKCCYEDQNLAGKNFKGANLGSANFTGAILTNANLSGANAGKACFVDANLTGATINGSTNLGGAIFCRTTMPDGTINNSGCAKGTKCCAACDIDHPCDAGQLCCNGRCKTGDCCTNADCTDSDKSVCLNNICSPCTEDGQCGADLRCCDGTCIRTSSDPDNGDRCGNSCTSTEICDDGACQPCDVCPSGCPFTTVQAAVTAASNPGTIRICAGTYLTNVSTTKSLTLLGAGDGANGTILDGSENGAAHVLLMIGNSTNTIRDLTITRGNGGILIGGTLTLERVHVTDNTHETSNEPGINMQGNATLVLKESRITNNAAPNSVGGGIFNQGTLTLEASLIEGNSARRGGGIFVNGSTRTTNLTKCSFVTRNTATDGPGSGGGIFNQGTVTISGSSTVEDNTPDDCINNGSGTGCPAPPP